MIADCAKTVLRAQSTHNLVYDPEWQAHEHTQVRVDLGPLEYVLFALQGQHPRKNREVERLEAMMIRTSELNKEVRSSIRVG